MDEHRHDVIVVGGGPAGSTCATLLARAGYDVLLLERHKFPRFHIGESITAFGFEAFKKLGVYDELKRLNFVKKKGLEFVLREFSLKAYFFTEHPNEPGELPWAFQMKRAELDTVLLDNCKRSGAKVLEEQLVKQVLFDGNRAVGVEYKDLAPGSSDELRRAHARWIIDATGLAGLLNRQLKDNWYNDPLLENKIAVFAHWTGDFEITNTDEDVNFRLCVHDNRRDWAWFLPVDKHVVSLGVVLSQETAKSEVRSRTPEEIFYHYAQGIPYLDDFLRRHQLTQTEKFRVVKDYSYRCRRFHGESWALVGDSAGFIDPIFSTGLQLAFNSSFALVECLQRALAEERPDSSHLAVYSRRFDDFYRLNSMLVHMFYLARLDPRRVLDPYYMWGHLSWAGAKYRLLFIWYFVRATFTSRRTSRIWTEQLLFGNPDPDNVFARLCLMLSHNYDLLHGRQQTAGQQLRAGASAA